MMKELTLFAKKLLIIQRQFMIAENNLNVYTYVYETLTLHINVVSLRC